MALLGLFVCFPLPGQTACGAAHTAPGAFICYPRPAKAASIRVPDIFHLSAQANALPGRRLFRYSVLIDGRRVYQNKLALPSAQLSIETNIESPYSSGSHTLSLVVDNAGEDQVTGVGFRLASELGFCNEFSRIEARACTAQRNTTPLDWHFSDPHPFSETLARFTNNLARLHADNADAMALDDAGNLYTAAHSSSDVEVRRYRSDGSISYDHLVRFCGSGFISVSGIAVRGSRLWLAGNASACLAATPGTLTSEVRQPREPHVFLVALDTAKPGDSALLYATWLTAVPASVAALRVSDSGDAYLAGNTTAPDFPLTKSSPQTRTRDAWYGYLAVVNSAGTALRSSQLFPKTRFNALALAPGGRVYVTGRSGTALLIEGYTPGEPDPFYRVRFAAARLQEGRAISLLPSPSGESVLVAGQSNRSFVVSVDPCRIPRARFVRNEAIATAPSLALQPALDAASANEPHATAAALTVDRAPVCPGVR